MTLRAALISLTLLASPLQAAPLAPVTGNMLNGVPLAEALGRMSDLGSWQMRTGGWVHLYTLGAKGETACQSPDTDSSDCRLNRLAIIAYDAPTVGMDFTLYQSPPMLRWYVPKGAQPDRDANGDFTLPVEACSATEHRTADGPDYDWYAERYLLHVHEGANEDPGRKAAFAFRAEFEKLKVPRGRCEK